MDHLRDWHGTTRLLDRIAAAMVRRGHSVVIIAREGKASAKTPVSKLEYPHELIAVNIDSSGGRSRAREAIGASNIDICLVSLGNDGILHMPGLLRGSGVPFVFGDPHDPRVRTFAGWQPYESYGALAYADAIQTLLPVYVDYYPKPLRERVTEIGIPAPPPVDVDFEARRNKTVRTIVAVGRLNETMKRFSLLLQAFALLNKENKENAEITDWRLKIVGDGPYWEFYHIMAQQLGISRYVDFTGAVLDPGEHYEGADIFCSSSLIEGFPLVLSEAAAYALPLVGYRVCTAYASVITEDIGALADCTSEGATPAQLAEALRRLMVLSPGERERMGKRAREITQERYNGELLFDKWEKLLTDTIDKVRADGETALERVIRMFDKQAVGKKETLRHIDPEWDGLGPDSSVWTKEVLDSAAGEIASREDPFEAPEVSEASIEAENVRLRCEIVRLREDYKKLEKKLVAMQGRKR